MISGNQINGYVSLRERVLSKRLEEHKVGVYVSHPIYGLGLIVSIDANLTSNRGLPTVYANFKKYNYTVGYYLDQYRFKIIRDTSPFTEEDLKISKEVKLPLVEDFQKGSRIISHYHYFLYEIEDLKQVEGKLYFKIKNIQNSDDWSLIKDLKKINLLVEI